VKPDPRLQVIGFNRVRCRYTVDWVHLKPGLGKVALCRKWEMPRMACGHPPTRSRGSEGKDPVPASRMERASRNLPRPCPHPPTAGHHYPLDSARGQLFPPLDAGRAVC
jgi:hypothetical protein